MKKEKPLFIPLKTQFYEEFKRGEKSTEYRLYGPRWNDKTCRVGREVHLSCGYGKHRVRLRRVIDEFYKRDAHTFGSTVKADILECFGTLDEPIAEIRLTKTSG